MKIKNPRRCARFASVETKGQKGRGLGLVSVAAAGGVQLVEIRKRIFFEKSSDFIQCSEPMITLRTSDFPKKSGFRFFGTIVPPRPASAGRGFLK